MRLAAVVALGDLGASSYVEPLGALSRDPDLQVRRSAGRPGPFSGHSDWAPEPWRWPGWSRWAS